MMIAETIFAVASGSGKSGVAVIRLSGPLAHPVLRALAGRDVPEREAVLCVLRDCSGELLDRALVLRFTGPASFTGEDVVEFHVHGGRAVINGLLEALAAFEGLRPAAPGEFTRRAFLAGKMDLSEAEALADLIDSETIMQRKQALRGLSTSLGRAAETWRAELIDVRALAEASIDFSDEGDVPDDMMRDIRADISRILADLKRLLAQGHHAERIRDGFSVVIAGPPNAGKSTLLNALAQREAAIVSVHAGTTRDMIDVHLDLSGYPVTVTDTAGIRISDDPVESEGIRRTLARSSVADLVLWLSPDGERPMLERDVPVWRIRSKVDLLPDNTEPDELALSVADGSGLEALIDQLTAFAASGASHEEGAVITRTRHRHAVQAAADALERSLVSEGLEFLAEELRIASWELGRISGRTDPEQVLDVIFSRFCIGK